MLNTVSNLQWILIVSVLPVVNAESGRTIVDGVNMEKNIENLITGTLEIGMCGTRPFFFYDGSIKGSDVLILELLSKKMGFKYTVRILNHFEKLVQLVRIRVGGILISD